MARLTLEVITPERVMVTDEVDMVEACGALGEFGILPGHVTFLSLIVPSEVRIMKDGSVRYLATAGGYVEVIDDKVTFLLDAAEFSHEIDVDRALRAKERAEMALQELSLDQTEYKVCEGALMRAVARISTAARAG